MPLFETLLNICAKQVEATLIPQYAMRTAKDTRIVIDGVVLDEHGLPFAYWEAKDTDDDLSQAVQQKRDAGYPIDNIVFQTPERGALTPERTGRIRPRYIRACEPYCLAPNTYFHILPPR